MTACVRRLLPVPFLAALALATACGGGGGDGDGTVMLVDAPSPDAPVDAAAPVCNSPSMVCDNMCVDVTSSEQFCGNCTTACTGGRTCQSSMCKCPDGFVPASPNFLPIPGVPQVIEDAQLGTAGVGPYAPGGGFTPPIHALVVGFPSGGARPTVDTDYPLDGDLAGGPFSAAGYDLDLQNMFQPAAAYFATAGTVRFTQICTDANGAVNGLAGRMTNVTFTGVDSIENPTPLPGGCSFPVQSITFDYGEDCSGQ